MGPSISNLALCLGSTKSVQGTTCSHLKDGEEKTITIGIFTCFYNTSSDKFSNSKSWMFQFTDDTANLTDTNFFDHCQTKIEQYSTLTNISICARSWKIQMVMLQRHDAAALSKAPRYQDGKQPGHVQQIENR